MAEKRDGEWVVNEWAKKAILLSFRLQAGRADRGGPVQLLRQGSAEAGRRVSRRARRAAGGRTLRLVPLAGRRDDAELRQHRRLGRAPHDGRHVGHRRLLRPDRRRRAPLRRRRHRRRARAAAGVPGDRRGRRLRRLALHRRRGRRRGRAGRPGRERRPHRVHADHRRHRAGAGRDPRSGTAPLRRRTGNTREGASLPARTTCRRRSSSAGAPSRPT